MVKAADGKHGNPIVFQQGPIGSADWGNNRSRQSTISPPVAAGYVAPRGRAAGFPVQKHHSFESQSSQDGYAESEDGTAVTDRVDSPDLLVDPYALDTALSREAGKVR